MQVIFKIRAAGEKSGDICKTANLRVFQNLVYIVAQDKPIRE
ncbi:MAG: hypothetical protein UV59_C0027G0008 [Candidatus Gottesmanbacteria bacterium GW2011_GWA1_43_11]|uniref:Uncharacterized protein n=1 Tax=Candidatus Gottesmanbacteria bacterium GW2011_GWA1_43_11 TaxID=1618436 RepID=A0A0G1CEF9_9BACT|nr:MAG: hypothetical protein UV59_C0027G0008 [Candidatus Gottesmanbacteria bacterium GW2011_GWA1_43_11]